MDAQKSISVIFLAGGKGSRLGSAQPKQFISLHGKPLALHSFELLLELQVKEFVVVCEEEYRNLFTTSIRPILFADPGKERMFSVFNGLTAFTQPVDCVLTHDAARPFLKRSDLLRLLDEGSSVGAATLASPIASTIKRADTKNFVIETLPRETLWDTQTPQLINHSILREGLTHLIREDRYVTDEMGVAETLLHPVKIIPGNPLNFKVTTMKDLVLAQILMENISS